MVPPIFGSSCASAVAPKKQQTKALTNTRFNMTRLSDDLGKQPPFNALVHARRSGDPGSETGSRKAHRSPLPLQDESRDICRLKNEQRAKQRSRRFKFDSLELVSSGRETAAPCRLAIHPFGAAHAA
jgi:hypothetical protein